MGVYRKCRSRPVGQPAYLRTDSSDRSPGRCRWPPRSGEPPGLTAKRSGLRAGVGAERADPKCGNHTHLRLIAGNGHGASFQTLNQPDAMSRSRPRRTRRAPRARALERPVCCVLQVGSYDVYLEEVWRTGVSEIGSSGRGDQQNPILGAGRRWAIGARVAAARRVLPSCAGELLSGGAGCCACLLSRDALFLSKIKGSFVW